MSGKSHSIDSSFHEMTYKEIIIFNFNECGGLYSYVFSENVQSTCVSCILTMQRVHLLKIWTIHHIHAERLHLQKCLHRS
jgi:hypothetical protein